MEFGKDVPLPKTPTLRRITSHIPTTTSPNHGHSTTNPSAINENKLTDVEKRVGGFVARKHLKKRGNYDSALDNYNQKELRQMDEALIGISNEMLKAQPREEPGVSTRNPRKLLSKPSYANIIVKDGKVVANLTMTASPPSSAKSLKSENSTKLSTIKKNREEQFSLDQPTRLEEKPVRNENMRKQLSYSKSDVNVFPSPKENNHTEQQGNQIRPGSRRFLERTSTNVESLSNRNLKDILTSHESSFQRRGKGHYQKVTPGDGKDHRESDSSLEPLDLEGVENVSDGSASLHSFGDGDVEDEEQQNLQPGKDDGKQHSPLIREDSVVTPIEDLYHVSDTIEPQYHNSQANDSNKVLTSFGSFSIRVSKITGQLNRSNSRSFVILGDTPAEIKSPRPLQKSDSLPYKKPSTSNDKRSRFLGTVAERDSRGSSDSFGGEIASNLSSNDAAKQMLDDPNQDSSDESTHTITSTKSAAEKTQDFLVHSKPVKHVEAVPEDELIDRSSSPSKHRIYHEASTSGNPSEMSTEERLLRASMHLQDAIYERPLTSLMPGMFALRLYIFQHGVIWGWIMKILMVGHLLLILLEPPCHNYAHYHHGVYPTSFSNYNCHIDEDYEGIIYPIDCFQQLVNYSTMRRTCLIVESIIILFYLIDISMNIKNLGWHSIFGLIPEDRSNIDSPSSKKNRLWDLCRTLTVVIMLMDIILNWTVTHVRFSRIFRPLIFVYKSRELRRWLYLILSTLPKITGLALLIFSFITVYAIIGILLFSERNFYEGGRFEYANFNSFGKASIVLYVLMSSENYPYIMYPAFNGKVERGSHYYALFFVSFLLCVLFFLSNLAVPYLFDSFKKSHVHEALSGRIQERMSLLAAFQLIDIDNSGYINLSQFTDLVKLIRPDLFTYQGKEKTDGIVEFMFDEICSSYPEKCYPLDFFQVPTIILTQFERLPTRDSKLYQLEATIVSFRYHFIPYFINIYMERFILICIFINTTILACYSKDNPRNDDIIKWSDYFLALYLFELSIKFLLLGWENITNSLIHLYDTVIIILAIVGKILDFIYPNTDDTLFPHSASVIISLRALRLIPALGIFNRLNVIAQILPFMFYSMLTVWLFIYIFAVLGLDIFATKYFHDTTIEVYSDDNIQFDNFVGAMMALFQVLVSNNWDEIMYTGMYSTGSIFYPALYFISFHFITASLLLQLVIAIYVEAFETFSEEQKKEIEPASTASASASNHGTSSPSPYRRDSSEEFNSPPSPCNPSPAHSSPATKSPSPPPLASSLPAPLRSIQDLPGYLFKQTSQRLFPSNSNIPTPQGSFEENQTSSSGGASGGAGGAGGGNGNGCAVVGAAPSRRDMLEKTGSLRHLSRPAPLPVRHSSSNLNHPSRNATSSKPLHKFVRKSAVPKSAIHSLARVHLKEFEDDELEQIKILGDVDVKKEIELRDDISKKIELQITLHEKTLKEMIQRHSLTIKKTETFESLRGSFDENLTTGVIEI